MGSQRMFEGHSCGELLVTLQTLPRSNVGNGCNHNQEKNPSGKYRHEDRQPEVLLSKSRARFFRNLSHRLKSGYEPGNDLPNQQDRKQGGMTEQGMQV